MTKNIQFNFENRCAVITGGAQGIGFEVAKAFLDAGARVSIWDYSEEALAKAKSALAAQSDRLHLAQVDVSRMASCQAAAEQLPFRIDILLNNAGITRDKSFAKMTSEEWQTVIDTNLTGLFNVTKALFEKFSDQAGKRIINISSVVALYGNFGQTNYVAAKAGVVGMTKTWAREFSKKGFTVNAIAPGFVKTAMVAKMPPDILKSMAEKVPLQRMGEPRDIANAVLFLSSEEAGYINGAVISVDGGLIC